MIIKKLIFLSILIISVKMLCGQSPWVQSKNGLYSQISISFIPEYDEIYSKNNTTYFSNRKLQDMTLQGYVEYGLLPNSTLLFIMPLKILKSGIETKKSNSILPVQSGTLVAPGNFSIGWRQKFLEQFLIFSGQILVELPTASYEDNTGLRTGYDAWGVHPLISAGKGFARYYLFRRNIN